jgi:aspartyl protease family protein
MRHAIVWLVLGTALFLAFQAVLAQKERTRFIASDGVVTLKRAPDGHYHWPGSVNGVAVDFLVDTGATRTALPQSLAERAGLPKVGMSRSSTAGGDVVVTDSLADVALQGGLQVQRLRVGVMPQLDTALLGMDVLGKLNVSQSQGEMRISGGAITGTIKP